MLRIGDLGGIKRRCIMNNGIVRFVRIVGLAVLVVAATGCRAVGPGTISRDRFDYTSAISDSWKRQMLLNLVKLRYSDAPVFLDESSIITQYSLETSVNARMSWDEFLPGDSQADPIVRARRCGVKWVQRWCYAVRRRSMSVMSSG